MDRSLVLQVGGIAGLLGALAGAVTTGGGWGAMQPMGLVAGGIVGYAVSDVADAIFDGLLAGVLGGLVALALGGVVRFVELSLLGADAGATQWTVFNLAYGLFFVPGVYVVGALVAGPTVYYLSQYVGSEPTAE